MTTGSPPPEPPRSHRGGAPSTSIPSLGLVALAGVTAVVLVLVGVGVVGWLRPNHDSTSAAGASSSQTSTSPSQSPSPSPSGSVSGSGKPSSSPSKSPSPKPSKSPSKSPSPKPSKSPSKSPSPTPTPTHTSNVANVPRDFPVVVLNETRIRGLAAQVANDLRAKGWTVTGVGNWQGAVPETTVYYPAGQRSRALRLAADVGVTRVRPVVQHMLPNRLTLVLHDPPR